MWNCLIEMMYSVDLHGCTYPITPGIMGNLVAFVPNLLGIYVTELSEVYFYLIYFRISTLGNNTFLEWSG
jgi:hypothetical protein